MRPRIASARDQFFEGPALDALRHGVRRHTCPSKVFFGGPSEGALFCAGQANRPNNSILRRLSRFENSKFVCDKPLPKGPGLSQSCPCSPMLRIYMALNTLSHVPFCPTRSHMHRMKCLPTFLARVRNPSGTCGTPRQKASNQVHTTSQCLTNQVGHCSSVWDQGSISNRAVPDHLSPLVSVSIQSHGGNGRRGSCPPYSNRGVAYRCKREGFDLQ